MTALDLFAIIGVVSVPASLGLGAALWAARAELRARREQDGHQLNRRVIEEALINSRQLESTVDSMSVELERLAESQRYLARALMEPLSPARDDRHLVVAPVAAQSEALRKQDPAASGRTTPVP